MSERTFTQSPEDQIADVLSRYTVTDLVEQSNADLEHGDQLFYAAKGVIEIVAQGETNLIRWWRIASGRNQYEVRRFKNFVWCSCKSFFFSKKICKHLAFTAGVYCMRCREVSAKKGKYCYECDHIVNRFQKKEVSGAII